MNPHIGQANIRQAELNDCGALARVYIETWRDSYPGQLPDHVLLNMSVESQINSWSSVLSRGGYINILEYEGSLVGFISYGSNRLLHLGYETEVFSLYVMPKFQGLGLGKLLFGSLFNELIGSGSKSLILWVLASNPSRYFYEVMGGKVIAEKDETLWGCSLRELAYGWRPLVPFAVTA